MKQARFVAAARREFLQEVTFYNREQAGLGGRFIDAVESAIARALAYPSSGSPATQNTRRLFLKDFPYALVYRSDDQGIIIFALAHHARKPGYWKSRAKT